MISRPPSRSTRAFDVRSIGLLAILPLAVRGAEICSPCRHGIIVPPAAFWASDRRFQVMANTREPILQPIPILSLRPTQMTVGMREVKEKRKRWRGHKSAQKAAELVR